jgi:hypothetical protein
MLKLSTHHSSFVSSSYPYSKLILLGVNVVPVNDRFGYVNCAGEKNSLAKYEIGNKLKATERLKSKYLTKADEMLTLFSW